MFAFLIAIGLTELGVLVLAKQKKNRAKTLRAWSAEAVGIAAGLTLDEVGKNDRLLALCVNLSGEAPATIRARAQFYSTVDPESLRYYLPSGSQVLTAAHLVALLTDQPARWLFDCATNRRGTLRPT